MVTKRVLLIESGHFIGGVIHNLFEQNDKLTVIEAQPQSSTAMIHDIEHHHPDVIVIDDTLNLDCVNDLFAYLRKNNQYRIIIVNTNANQIDIYQKQQVSVRQSADLFEVI